MIPGKEEFHETMHYYQKQLELNGVEMKLSTPVSAKDIFDGKFDHVLICTGVVPNIPPIEGIKHPKVSSYIDVITKKAKIGSSVAIIGSGF